MVQAAEVSRAIRKFLAAGVEPVWHDQECGCCVMVHQDMPHPPGGWLIGEDGSADWYANPELS